MTETCNICGGTAFADFAARPRVQCVACRSLERTRLLGLYLDRMVLPEGARVLHVAPEKGLYDKLSARPEIGAYTVADFTPALYDFVQCEKIDLCDLGDWPTGGYDLILHSHVLEHTLCNIAYSLFHLHRMLAPAGRHVFIVPFARGRYDECFQPLERDERIRRFGQWDHVRRFGVEDLGTHLGAVVRLPERFDATDFATPEALRRANVPEAFWTGIQASTILDLGKDDYRLA